MRIIYFFVLLSFSMVSTGQIGIGTEAPQGILDINSDSLGVILPRVDSLQDNVGSLGGGAPQMGTVVFNKSDSCFYGFNGLKWYKFAMEGPGIYPENSPPTASITGVTGTYFHGSTIEVSYLYEDLDEDIEVGTIINWYYKSGSTFVLDAVNANGTQYSIDTINTHSIGDSIRVEIIPVANSGVIMGDTTILTLSEVVTNTQTPVGETSPIVLAYFPSWQESFPSENSSPLRNIPLHVSHVFLAFAKPNLSYTLGSYDISNTGLNVPYDGCALASSIAIMHEKGQKVILSIGGETYWGTPEAYNINYQMIKDLVDDMAFDGIDWDFEPNGSFAEIGSPENVDHFITFFEESRNLMPTGQYLITCAPSGVGCLGGQTNDDSNSPFAFAERNNLTGEDDTNLYNATVPTNGISLFGFSATGHMIPVLDSVASLIDFIAIQNYNVGASLNRKIMYDSYAYYADVYGFEIVAGTHFPDEPWGPYFEYNLSNVADLSDHIEDANSASGRFDGVFIWRALLSNDTTAAYSYLNIASKVLNGLDQNTAISESEDWTTSTYSGSYDDPCGGAGGTIYCGNPEYNINNSYPGGSVVHYDCFIWTANWYANPNEYPGQTSGQWSQGLACTEAPGCE